MFYILSPLLYYYHILKIFETSHVHARVRRSPHLRQAAQFLLLVRAACVRACGQATREYKIYKYIAMYLSKESLLARNEMPVASSSASCFHNSCINCVRTVCVCSMHTHFSYKILFARTRQCTWTRAIIAPTVRPHTQWSPLLRTISSRFSSLLPALASTLSAWALYLLPLLLSSFAPIKYPPPYPVFSPSCPLLPLQTVSLSTFSLHRRKSSSPLIHFVIVGITFLFLSISFFSIPRHDFFIIPSPCRSVQFCSTLLLSFHVCRHDILRLLLQFIVLRRWYILWVHRCWKLCYA